jgi:hypothetical protein
VTIGAQYSSTIFVADFETNQWFAASSGLGTSNISVDAFSGDNSTVAFTLSADPGSENNTQVYVSGVYQEKDTYSVSGTTLTFSTAPPTGTSNIEVVSSSPLAIGTPSDGTVTTAKIADANVTAAKLASGAARSNFGAGAVLQVVSTTKTDTFTTTSTSFTDITGISVSITPSSATSKIFVTCSFQFGVSSGSGYAIFRMLRDATVINNGVASGSRSSGILGTNIIGADGNTGQMLSTNFLDSPSTTSATTYKMQAAHTGGNTALVGTGNTDGNISGQVRSASTITVMEISA